MYPVSRGGQFRGIEHAGVDAAGTTRIGDVPAYVVPEVIPLLRRGGGGAVAVLSAGFREAGERGAAQARSPRRPGFLGLRCSAPTASGLDVSSGPSTRASPQRALGRSRRVCDAVGRAGDGCDDWVTDGGIGFSHVVSLGHGGRDSGDLIDYLAVALRPPADDSLHRDGNGPAQLHLRGASVHAAQAARGLQGRALPWSAQATVSHWGHGGRGLRLRLSLRAGGIVRVGRISQVFATRRASGGRAARRSARLKARNHDQLAGGPGVMAAGTSRAAASLPSLRRKGPRRRSGRSCRRRPPSWPVDVLGDAPPDNYGDFVESARPTRGPTRARDTRACDVVSPGAHEGRRRGKATSRKRSAAWVGGPSVQLRLRSSPPRPWRPAAGQAVDAFGHLVSYARRGDAVRDAPRLPVNFALDISFMKDHGRRLEPRSFIEATSKTLQPPTRSP